MRRRDCFIIEQGCVYKGGGVVALSLNFEKAVEYASKLVVKEQKEDDRHREWCLKSHIEYVKKDPEAYEVKDPENYKGEYYVHTKEVWKEEEFRDGCKYWSNGMDFISIVKQKLI